MKNETAGLAPAHAPRRGATLSPKRVARWVGAGLIGWTVVAQAQGEAPIVGKADAGQNKNSMCVGCHGIPGYKASFPLVYQVPMIHGQTQEYIVAALSAYRKGDRDHPTMRAIAGSLTDQDIADLAAYYGSK